VTLDIDSSESPGRGAYEPQVSNGRAQDGPVSAGETGQGVAIDGLTLKVSTSALRR